MEFEFSVILPLSHDIRHTMKCLEALARNTGEGPYEVIVVTPSSSDIGDDLLPSRMGEVTIRKHGTQDCVADSCNQAVKLARGRYLVFLNDQTEPQKGCFERLAEVAREHSSVGAVGAKIIDTKERILEAGFSYLEEGVIKGNGEGSPAKAPRHDDPRQIDSLSRHCTLITRDAWVEADGLDSNISDLGLAMIDLGFTIRSKAKSICYQPRAVVKLQRPLLGEIHEGLAPSRDVLRRLRPDIPHVMQGMGWNGRRKRVLVLGIYLASKLNNVADTVSILSKSEGCRITQRWIALGGPPPTRAVADVTTRKNLKKRPKFQIMNEMLTEEDLSQYEYVLIVDDDVVLPVHFTDQFLALQESLEFSIAQPARTSNSFIDHPIVEQQMGVLARQTLFVEIGPVVSFHRSSYELVFPFDRISPMGWGYSNVWAQLLSERQLKMGMIDNTPVDHSLRRPVANYLWHEVDKQRAEFLRRHDHLPLEKCFKLIEVFSTRGTA